MTDVIYYIYSIIVYFILKYFLKDNILVMCSEHISYSSIFGKSVATTVPSYMLFLSTI